MKRKQKFSSGIGDEVFEELLGKAKGLDISLEVDWIRGNRRMTPLWTVSTKGGNQILTYHPWSKSWRCFLTGTAYGSVKNHAEVVTIAKWFARRMFPKRAA